MAEEKKESQLLKEKLARTSDSAWERLPEGEHKHVFSFAEEYKHFLREAKTEREIVKWIQTKAEKQGYQPFENAAVKSGAKLFITNKGKNIALLVIGKNGVDSGLRIIASHIDALRLDLKSAPFYEDGGLVMMNTHYYGGIKKYHWVNTPLALHGVIFTKDGKRLDVSIGENENEPVFVIPDLLPHVGGRAFAEKKTNEVITGESLDAVAASLPLFEKDAVDKVKLRLYKYLNEKYGVIEEDFFSAELQLVPAIKPRDIGFDGSLMGAYAHDDRSCSYANMASMLDLVGPADHTCMAIFMDKEEIGSTGATGADSLFLENVVEQICSKTNSQKTTHQVLADAKIISADVTSALDPKYREFFDSANVNYVGYGVSVERGTGYGGKYEGSEATAEFMSFIRTLFNKEKIPWQTGEISKVDEGGGGTVAKYFAKYGCDIIDIGPPVLAMHSPCEILSKVDLYCAFKGYKAFFETK